MKQPTEQSNDKEQVPNFIQSGLAAACHCCGTREKSGSAGLCEEPHATAASGTIPLAQTAYPTALQRNMDIFIFH